VLNSYIGGVYQQALSALSYIDSANYNGQSFAQYGYEWWSNPSNRPEGYIQWYSEGQPTWKITPASIGADTTVGISARLIPEEPMVSCLLFVGRPVPIFDVILQYIILNLGLARE